jgi:PAT family beta-lactamase induction signal transducer AmpG
LRWRGAALVLGFAALYRFGDYFMQTLLLPFLQGSVGFTKTEIAVVQKGVGFLGTLVGGLAAGALAARFGLRRMLVAFGVLAAMTNLLYGSLAATGHNMPLFCSAIFVDYATTALATAAFLSVLMAATSPAVSATQFALLTSLSSVGHRVFGSFAGDVVHALGWSGFFAATAAMAIPGIAFAWWIARDARLSGDASASPATP